jgi:DNA-3-methyladenine glycosylase I
MTDKTMDDKPRCHWCVGDAEMTAYHDEEWGTPIDGDDDYLERMLLEVFQAGLSWRTILRKRPAFRAAFYGFSIDLVAAFGPDDIARLLGDASIVRHRGKIEASIENARRFQQIRADHGSFHSYLAGLDDDPASLRRELRKGFLFMGPKIADSFLESVGRIPAPHQPGCWRGEPG